MSDAGDRTAAWTALRRLADAPRADGEARTALTPLFIADPDRGTRWQRRGCGLLLDVSRTALDAELLAALLALAETAGLPGRLRDQAAGAIVNPTEGRAALHTALRAPSGSPLDGGPAIAREVAATRDRMQAFAEGVTGGTIVAADGGRYTDVLNIGIGGSDLGPAMAARALYAPDPAGRRPRPHFLANVDAHAWEGLRPGLDPRRTLVLIASKTFTTQETLANASLVRGWLAATLGEAGAATQLVALSTNRAGAAAFGIPPERVFPFADWVGGRFSLWSAIGLSLTLCLGWDGFAALLSGAHAMDRHATEAAPAEHLPLLLALLDVWHGSVLGLSARAVLPYDDRLGRLPAHLQQLEMESLGKGVTLAGASVRYATGGVVFGEPGTPAQHSFLQLLHQGSRPVPAEILLVARPDHAHPEHHRMLLANGLAQAEALLRGRSAAEAEARMRAAGLPAADAARLAPHRAFPGDRPSTVLVLPRLDPFHLGALVALYEHKVACLGALWDIAPFDQWGVELGKERAGALLPALEGDAAALAATDPATRPLLDALLTGAA